MPTLTITITEPTTQDLELLVNLARYVGADTDEPLSIDGVHSAVSVTLDLDDIRETAEQRIAEGWAAIGADLR